MAKWTFRSISGMHLSKDTMRGQLSQADIDLFTSRIATLNNNFIEQTSPLDEDADYLISPPVPGYVQKWVNAARANNLKIFWRGAWNSFENGPGPNGNYDFMRQTPTGVSPRALGTAANVLNGTDTSSYLYKCWNWIKTHGSWIEAGDAIGLMPEPENQGVGGLTTDMFPSHAVLEQWLIDMKIVCDDALETYLGFAHEEVLTGMTSINGGTIETGQIGALVGPANGRVLVDHYIPSGSYSTSLNNISANSGGVDMYIGEYGTTGGVGAPANDTARAAMINADFSTFASKSFIKGVNYWQAVGGSPTATERIMSDSFVLDQPLSSGVISDYFLAQTPDPTPPPPPPPPPDPDPEPPPVPTIPVAPTINARHQIIVKDKAGTIIGEISDWFNLKFSDQVNNYGQATFDIPIDSDDATNLISLRRYEIDIVQNGVIVWSGEQVNADVTLKADSPNLITILCYTYFEMFNARKTDDYIRFDQIDQMRIVKEVVDISQAKPDGDFGFTFAPIAETKLRDREYKKDNLMELMINITNVIDGIDIWIDHLKVIHGANTRRGVDKSNQYGFEWGINIEELKISDNFATPANTAYAIGSSDGITPLIESFTDTQARHTYKLREQSVSAIDVSEADTLIGKAEDLVNSNKNQRRTLSVIQLPNTSPNLENLNLGDSINVRCKKGRYDINSPFRILGYECTIGAVGEAHVSWIVSDFQSSI